MTLALAAAGALLAGLFLNFAVLIFGPAILKWLKR
jgi:hypothetical protein